jgi:hypothetical protein
VHPPTIQDPIFGELRFDPADYLRWYEGVAPFAPDHEVQVLIFTEGGEPFEILARARAAFASIQRREPEYPPAAAKTLLQAYNENWNEGAPLDAVTFASRLGFYRFSFHPDGKVELDYDDDDLFLGHSITVRLNQNLEVVEVGLEG